MKLFVLLLFISLVQGDIIMSNSSVLPIIAGSSNTSYSFGFQTQSALSISSSHSLIIQFTGPFVINFVSNCFISINGDANTTFCRLLGGNKIQFYDIVSSQKNINIFTFSFHSNGANYASSVNIPVYFSMSQSNTTSMQDTAYFTITAGQMTGCNITSNSNIVGAQSTWSLTFTPTITLSSTNILRVTFNKWGPDNQSNFKNTSQISCSRGNCNFVDSLNTEYLSISSIFSSTLDSQTLTISKIRNPSSTYQSTILFQIFTSNNVIQTCNVQFKVQKPANLNINLPSISQTISNVNNNVQITIVQQIPLQANGFIQVTSQLPVSYSPFVVQSTLPTIVSSSNGWIIGNLASSTIKTFYRLGNFTITNPPSIYPVSIKITTMILVSSTYYHVSSGQINITPKPSSIITSSLNFFPKNANKIAQYYQLRFTTINSLKIGSFMIVVFPSQTTLNQNTSCTTSIGICTSIVNTKTLNISLNADLTKSSNVLIVVTNVLNPYTTVQSSSFSINTYYNSTNSLVDTLSSGLTIVSQSNPLSNIELEVGNLTVGAISSYKFTISFTNPVLSGSILRITFPTSIDVSSITSDICTLSKVSNIVILQNCFISTTSSITINFNNIRNPNSVQTTSNFNVTLNSGNSIVEYLNSSLTVKMNILSSLILQVEPTVSTVNSITSYKFTAILNQTHLSNDVMIITVPAEITLNNVSCSAISGVSGVSCSYVSPNLTVTLSFTSFPSNRTIQFSASSFTNNWYVSSSMFSAVTSSNGNQKQSGTTTVSYSKKQLEVTVSNDQNIVLLDNSKVSFTITPPFSMSSSGLSLIINLPSTTLNATNCNSTANTICTISNNVITVSGLNGFQSSLIVQLTTTTGYFTSTVGFLMALYYNNNLIAQNSNVVVSSFCNFPCKQCQSTNKSSCISCLPSPYTALIYLVQNNQSCVSQCPLSTYISALLCLPCTGSCLSCLGNSTHCLSCKSGTYFFNNTCSGSCPNGTYSNVSQCTACNPSCKTCSSLVQCTSCPASQYLFNSSCLPQCPVTYYFDNSNNCQTCGLCQSCTSLTNCTNCKNNYYLINSRCYESCPSTYPIPSDGTCLQCDSTCLSCQSSTINCTSCSNGTFLYNNKCLNNCPSSFKQNSLINVCQSVQQSMIYFPGVFSSLALLIIVGFSKFFFRQTSFPTSLTALLSIPQFVVYCYFLYLVVTEGKIIQLALACTSLSVLIVMSIAFIIITVVKIHSRDQYYKHWYNSYKAIAWIFNIISCLNYKLYRLTYSRIFHFQSLSSCYKNNKGILYLTTGSAITGLLAVEMVMIISCIISIYWSQQKDQLFFEAIDVLIISICIGLMSVLDIPKDEHYFINSPFLKNRVHIIDANDHIVDQIGDKQFQNEQHESCRGKGNLSIYKMQSGQFFDVTNQKIKLGQDSIAQSFNTGLINFDSQTLKHKHYQRSEFQRRLEQAVDIQDSGIISKLDKLDSKQLQQEVSPIKSKVSQSLVNQNNQSLQKQKSQQQLIQQQITEKEKQKQRKKRLNIFDPIQQQTQQQLLNQLQSFRSDEQIFGDDAIPRRKSLGKQKNDSQHSNEKYNRSTISVFNNKQLKRKWNNIIQSKIEILKAQKQGLKPHPIDTINQMSEMGSNIIKKRKKLRKPKKQYHNKQLQQIYLQRIVPASKKPNSRISSAKFSFRSSKYNL